MQQWSTLSKATELHMSIDNWRTRRATHKARAELGTKMGEQDGQSGASGALQTPQQVPQGQQSSNAAVPRLSSCRTSNATTLEQQAALCTTHTAHENELSTQQTPTGGYFQYNRD